MHKIIKDNNSGNSIILHTHPTDIIALTHDKTLNNETKLNKVLWSMHPETLIAIPQGAGFIPYMPCMEIANATIRKARKHNFIIWNKHGVFSIGNDILRIFDTIDVVNKSASIYLKCKSAGIEPGILKQRRT